MSDKELTPDQRRFAKAVLRELNGPVRQRLGRAFIDADPHATVAGTFRETDLPPAHKDHQARRTARRS